MRLLAVLIASSASEFRATATVEQQEPDPRRRCGQIPVGAQLQGPAPDPRLKVTPLSSQGPVSSPEPQTTPAGPPLYAWCVSNRLKAAREGWRVPVERRPTGGKILHPTSKPASPPYFREPASPPPPLPLPICVSLSFSMSQAMMGPTSEKGHGKWIFLSEVRALV